MVRSSNERPVEAELNLFRNNFDNDLFIEESIDISNINAAKVSHVPRFQASEVAAIAGLNPFRTPIDMVGTYLYQDRLLCKLQYIDANVLGADVVSDNDIAESTLRSLPPAVTLRLKELQSAAFDNSRNNNAEAVKSLVTEVKNTISSHQNSSSNVNIDALNHLTNYIVSDIQTSYGISTEETALDKYEKLTGYKVVDRNQVKRYIVVYSTPNIEYDIHSCGYIEHDEHSEYEKYRSKFSNYVDNVLYRSIIQSACSMTSPSVTKVLNTLSCKGCESMEDNAPTLWQHCNSSNITRDCVTALPSLLGYAYDSQFSVVSTLSSNDTCEVSKCLFVVVERVVKHIISEGIVIELSSIGSCSALCAPLQRGHTVNRRIIYWSKFLAYNRLIRMLNASYSVDHFEYVSSSITSLTTSSVFHQSSSQNLEFNSDDSDGFIREEKVDHGKMKRLVLNDKIMSLVSRKDPKTSESIPIKNKTIDFIITGRFDGVSYQVKKVPNSFLKRNSNENIEQKKKIIIECKNRVNSFHKDPPLYDQIQLVTYMIMGSSYAGDLVEAITSSNKNESQCSDDFACHRITRYGPPHFHDDNWHEIILPRLKKFSDFIRLLRLDDGLRYRWLLADDLEKYEIMREFSSCDHFDFSKYISKILRSRAALIDQGTIPLNLPNKRHCLESFDTTLDTDINFD